MAEANKEELEGESKKEKKKREKKEKKQKKNKNGTEENETGVEEQESIGSKIILVFVTLLIIVIWLGIIAILIKCDVGGFGSSVLHPLLKDVPYVNKILPSVEYEFGTESTEYQFDSLEEAVDRIKELEILLDEANNTNSKKADKVKQLKAQVEELSVYKEEQADFEKEKEKYYEEVVFSDNAPDINEYKAYYESIDPANAEVLYKQVVEQLQQEQEIQEYAATYAAMKPKEAAAIFNTMTSDLKLVSNILSNMESQARADILGKMDADVAAKVTAIMEP